MNKKIFYTLLGALVAVGLALLAWWWFFSQPASAPSGSGGFGTAQNATGGFGATGPETNIPSHIPSEGSIDPRARTVSLGQGSTLKNGTFSGKISGQILLALGGTPISGIVGLGQGSVYSGMLGGTNRQGTLAGQVTLGPGSTIQNGQITLGPGSTIQNATVASGGNTTIIPNAGALVGIITLGPGSTIQNGQITLGPGNTIQTQPTLGPGTTVQNGQTPLGPGGTVPANNPTAPGSTITGIVTLGPGTVLPNGLNEISNTAGVPVGAGPLITGGPSVAGGPPIVVGTVLGNGPIIQNGGNLLDNNGNPLSNTSGNPVGAGPTIQTTPANLTIGQYSVPEVVWLNPTLLPITLDNGSGINPSGTGRTLVGTVFNPTPINQVGNSNPTGGVIPAFGVSNNGQGVSDGNGFLATAGIAAAAGAISCGAAQLFETSAATVGGPAAGIAQVQVGAAADKVAVPLAASALAAPTLPLSVSTYSLGTAGAISVANSNALAALGGVVGGIQGHALAKSTTDTFWGCIARTLAKVALQQITSSVVNWINSGFNGTPSFVQNPTSFFQNVADNAAGDYIKSSALSFLCSPFKLQIKIAIAKSYANRGAQSCTLASITKNINGFMNGNFSAGGWGSLLQFTAVPTNNPYGAFAYASVGLQGSIARAVGAQQNDLTLGQGFLSFKQQTNCRVVSEDVLTATPPNQSFTEVAGPTQNGVPIYRVCDWKTTTPGRVIADALGATEKSTLDQLTLAKSFDEIISALISQLMTRTLQGGLSNLSGQSGYADNFITPDQQQAQTAAQGLLAQMQRDTSAAQQYGALQQGSIQDIQSAQSHIQTLVNCWASAATGSTTPEKVAIANTNAAAASSTLASLEPQVENYNNHITLANQAIAALEALESRTLSAGSMVDISGITQDYQAAQASGALVVAADVTLAQQNRTTLQSQMAILNQQTNAGLAQCYAF